MCSGADPACGEAPLPLPEPVRWRVIGIGSPVIGDGVGWDAIAVLRADGLDGKVELIALDRPGPGLIALLEPGHGVILIDAMHSGLPAGSVREIATDELLSGTRMPSTHDLGVAESLLLAEALGQMPARLHLIGVESSSGAGGWREQALREVVERVRGLIG